MVKIGMMLNFGSENPNMTFIFEIDDVLINYSLKVTYCHFGVKQSQRMVKIGKVVNFVSENSNMTFIFEIDEILINYS